MAGNAMAQDKTCDDVVWNESVLAQYPAAAEACREVRTHEGRDYIKINAIFHKIHNNGAVTISIVETDGDAVRRSFMPKSETRVWIDGEQKRWQDLYDRQEINLYIPSDRFEFVAMDEMQAPGPAQVAMVVEESTEEPVAAPPHTASNRPLMVALGALMLALGGGIGFMRRFQALTNTSPKPVGSVCSPVSFPGSLAGSFAALT